jgi:hypothetical protein
MSSFITAIVAAPVPSVATAMAAACNIWGMMLSDLYGLLKYRRPP